MKRLLLVVLMLLLTLPATAWAGDQPLLRVKIIDQDPKGTNMRDTPKGKIVYTIPLKPADELERIVSVYEQEGEWFLVTTEAEKAQSGWMHSSVLGLRGGSTEDGPCPLRRDSSEKSPVLIKPKAGAVLQLLGATFNNKETQAWYKVRYKDSSGKSYDGWVPQQCE